MIPFDWFRVKPADPPPKRAPHLRPPRRRDFEGASTGRLFSDWTTVTTSADAELRRSLRTLRARARDLEDNNDHAKRFLHLVETNVAGPRGVTLQVRAKEPNGTLDAGANTVIEREWAEWGKRGNCTVDGRMTWIDVQRLFMRTVARDGECFIIKVRDRGNRWGYRLQFMDADLCDEEKNGRAPNGNEIRMGVEVDAAMKPVAYWFRTRHPNDFQYQPTPIREAERRVEAARVIHAYIVERYDQTRGKPWMRTAGKRLKMLGGYEEAEVVAARVAASKMGFFKPEGSEEYAGDDEAADGTTITEVAPGQLEQLPTGMDFQPFDPQHPTTAFDPFVKAVLRGAAAGLDVSYASLSGDLTQVNYSSARIGLLDERDHWRAMQWWMIGILHNAVFPDWLEMAMTAGAITLPIAKFDKFNAPVWTPRGWKWVDPQKEADGALAAIGGGLATRTEILAEQGKDFEEVAEQLQAEREILESLGLSTETPRPPQRPVEALPEDASGN